MGMPAREHRRWTRAEVLALIEANPLHSPRYELVDGELLVTPSPTGSHQWAVRELFVELNRYLERSGGGVVFSAPFDVELESGSVTQPDLFVVPMDEANRLRSEMPVHDLLLAVELTSPGSNRQDRGAKRYLYQRTVPEYWIVDVDACLVERWLPNDDRPEILLKSLMWQPRGVEISFELELEPFFARVYGETGWHS
jgi:Uma2 family endonuclease